MRKYVISALAFLLFLTPAFAWARGGGGCLAEGTPVLTPSGLRGVEELRVGDIVWSFSEGTLKKAEVRGLTAVQADEFFEISAGEKKLLLTGEHPVMVGPGEYRQAEFLTVGDSVYLERNGSLRATTLRSVRRLAFTRPAYNLLVNPGGTFVSSSFVVHNKGCFLPESQILRADGSESSISALRPGDQLLAYDSEGRMVPTKIREIIQHQVDEYILLKTNRTTLRVTPDHPFYVGHGTFKTVEALRAGDVVFAWDGQSLSEQRIDSVLRVRERVPVYNLQTDHPNTFFAGKIVVHNKGGGCFPRGTWITTPRGKVAIETLAPGDQLLGVDQEGRVTRATVESLLLARSKVLRIETNRSVFFATEDHPIGLLDGRFLPVKELRPGEQIRQIEDGRLSASMIRGVLPTAREEIVFNLQVTEPHTFLAENVVVHNKGGGGGGGGFRGSGSRSSGSGGSSGGGIFAFIMIGIFITIFVLAMIASRRQAKSKRENLDFVYSRGQVDRKTKKTEKLLTFLSQQDSSLAPAELRKRVESTFRKLQECWQSRGYEPMKPLLVPALFSQHTAQLQGMVRNHEINKIENLKVERVDLVNVRYTEKPDQREFTALITASATDYYVDDRNGKFLRGDQSAARFQEFWTFHRVGDRWLLREIEQTGESDLLKEENFAEMLTDDTVKRIYAETTAQGTAGPWLEKAEEKKADRIDRLLNFLVQTDKLWDRQQMLERTRQVFMSVYLAKESGEGGQVPVDDLFPEVAKDLQEQIRRWKSDGLTVEYRNLCVRKTELILVRNLADRARDEFTVRIDAHAQRIVKKGDQVMSEQPYVSPFEEYWTFGRLDNRWKLKEVMPPGRAKKKVAEENLDQDSSSGQLQWYYGQTRAR
jgi:predicted lipid-binding transport protein (Tim44 family)/uncharacterized membrane protein YgcG